ALLTIIISLITGFIIGFILSSQITRIRTRDLRSMSSAETFKMRTYNIVKPGPDQLKDLDPVIDLYSGKFDSMRSVTHHGYQELIEEYHESLKPYLSDDQIVSLEDFAQGLRRKKHQEEKGKEEK
ncbi:MAG: hypothetical protein IH594_06720, partial [Bacteroidales bacterium]|nr:hypothetical protein [Bacteroidales bacterium]